MEKYKMPIIVIGVIITIIIMLTFMFMGVENNAIRAEEQVFVANSDVTVQEKRRVDLVYNLADIVKEYDKHESNTLKEVVLARGESGGDIENASTVIKATAEQYPELKSNENYKELMNELSTTENLIAQHRSNYNRQIKEYNRMVRRFPNRQILSFLGYEKIDFGYLEYDAPQDAPQNLFKKAE